MATISTPLGYKIVGQNAQPDTGVPIDDRQVFSGIASRDAYTPNFFYRGLLNYTIGQPYHAGVSNNSGYYTRYYDGSSYSWQGLVADAVDDKHAYGTISSSSNNTPDPSSGTNIVDHINYLYTLTKGSSSSRFWKDPVATVAALSSTYPSAEENWAALVEENNHIYAFNGTSWVDTGSNNVALLSASNDGIVNRAWYNTLNSFVTTPSNYLNNNNLSSLAIQNGGSGVTGSPIQSSQVSDTFTFNFTNGLTASVSGKTITVSGSTGLPDQSGNNGKFLTTNGTVASWASLTPYEPVINSGTGTQYWRGDKTWQELTTDSVTELQGTSKLFFSANRVRSTTLNGLDTSLTGEILSTDTIIVGFSKLQNSILNIQPGSQSITLGEPRNGLSLVNNALSLAAASAGTNGALLAEDFITFRDKQDVIPLGNTNQYYRGDKTWANLTTAVVQESGINKYLTQVNFDSFFYGKSGISGGFAPLNSSFKIPNQYLYSYVSSIVEAANYAALPTTGASNTIYVTTDNNRQYRWGSTMYVQISPTSVISVNGQVDVVTLTTTHIDEGTRQYHTERRVLDSAITSVGDETGDVLIGDSIELAITKLNNKVSSGLSLLNDDILFFNLGDLKYTPYSSESKGVLYKDGDRTIPGQSLDNSDFLKYSGGISTKEIHSEVIRISEKWIFQMSEDGNKLYLKHNPSGDNTNWIIVSTFESTNNG